jgi:hypothetical protein
MVFHRMTFAIGICSHSECGCAIGGSETERGSIVRQASLEQVARVDKTHIGAVDQQNSISDSAERKPTCRIERDDAFSS